MASRIRTDGHDVLHLSTALCPRDRNKILEEVEARLQDLSRANWTLVATSLVEAGVDLSFRTAFRERFTTASLIQVGGRSNRHSEQPRPATVHDFLISFEEGLRHHPAATAPASVLSDLFKEGRFEGEIEPADLVTLAMRREMRQRMREVDNELLAAERDRCYPKVAELGRVIDTDTRIVVVDSLLRERIAARDAVSTRKILAGSVQIWAKNIVRLGPEPIPGRQDVYWWPHAYDAAFLGYMEGALFLSDISEGAALII